MSERVWMAGLFYPAPLCVGVLVLEQYSGGGFTLPLGFLLALGFGSAVGFGLLRHPVWEGLGLVLLTLAVGVPIAYGPAAGEGWLGLSVGVLVGVPFLWLEFAWREDVSPGVRILALQSTFVAGIAFLAALATPGSPTGDPAGWQFLNSLGNALANQVQGGADLLSGTAPGTLPLEAAFNPVFVALGGVALVALVLSWISPRTALDEPLPWSWFKFPLSPTLAVPLSDGLELRDGQREALATRTRSSSPGTVLSPGFGSLLVAGLLVGAFLGLASVVPALALLGLAVATAAAMIGVARVLSWRLTPLGGLAG